MDIFNLRGTDFPQFYGFYFSDINTVNLAGTTAVSLTYEIIDGAAAASNPDLTALFIYELMLPRSTWR